MLPNQFIILYRKWLKSFYQIDEVYLNDYLCIKFDLVLDWLELNFKSVSQSILLVLTS